MRFKLHITLLIIFLGAFSLFAQETKEDIEKKAQRHFDKEEYLEATPLFLRLLSLEPRDPNFNYKYGTCILYSSDKKKDAFRYLNFAVRRGHEVDNEAYYFLGKAYHLTYQFDEAIQNYQIYKQKAGNRAIRELDVDRQIQMCRNGKALMAKVNDMVVLSKNKIDKESFFRIYNLKDIGGQLLVTNEFQTRQDVKYNHTPLIHFPSNSNTVYYSSYGERGENKDIYQRRRLPDGSWSLPQRIHGNVNTEYNEDFPYLDPNGRYLYFSSEGHNSMGGYDIFRSPYDAESNMFGEPENLDFPISTPDNDYFYIVDSLYRNAYFASSRETEEHNVNVYNVRVERFPLQIIILRGEFASVINPEEKKITIDVHDVAGKSMGTFTTSPTGAYLINLPKGGKYTFTMKVGDKEQVHKQTVDLPYLSEFRPLKQNILETLEEETEVVIIQNLFDERFENEASIIAEAMEAISKMEVNIERFDIDSLNKAQDERKVLEEIGLNRFSNDEILNLIKRKLSDLKERDISINELISKTISQLKELQKQQNDLLASADSLITLAENELDTEKKEAYTLLANQNLKKADQIKDQITAGQDLLTHLEEQREKNNSILNVANSINDISRNINAGEDEALIKLVNNNLDFFENELLVETRTDVYFEYLSLLNEKEEKALANASKEKDLQNRKEVVEEKIRQLNEEIEGANRRRREQLELELSRESNLLENIENEIAYQNSNIENRASIVNQKNFLTSTKNVIAEATSPALSKVSSQTQAINDSQSKLENRVNSIAENNQIDLDKNMSEHELTQIIQTESTGELASTEEKESIREAEERKSSSEEEEIVESYTEKELLNEIAPEYKHTQLTSNNDIPTLKIQSKSKTDVISKIDIAIQEEMSPVKKEALEKLKDKLKEEVQTIDNSIASIEEAQRAEQERITQENKIAEEAQRAEQERITQENRIAEEAQRAEQERIAEENRIVEETRETYTEEDLLKEIAPNYVEQAISNPENNSLAENKNLLKTKTELSKSIESAISNENSTIKTELLNELKDKIEKEISVLENTIYNQEAAKLAQEQLELEKSLTANKEAEDIVYTEEEVLAEIDPYYLDDIQELELNTHKSQEDIQELIDRKRRVLIEIGELIRETESQNKKEVLEKLQRKVSFEIGELEREMLIADTLEDTHDYTESSVSRASDDFSKALSTKEQDKLNELYNERESIGENLSQNFTKQEEKKLEKVEQEITKRESKALRESISNNTSEVENVQETYIVDDYTSTKNHQKELEIRQLIQEAEKEKDIVKKRDLLEEAYSAQNEIINQTKESHKQAIVTEVIEEIISEKNFNALEADKIFENESTLQVDQQEIGIQILETKDKINELDAQITSAKKKDKKELEELKTEFKQIQTELEKQYNEKTSALTEIQVQKTRDANKGVAESSINNSISYESEVEIAQSEFYKDLLKDNNKLTQLQHELSVKEKALASKQAELNQFTDAIEDVDGTINPAIKSAIEKQLNSIHISQIEIDGIRQEVEQQQAKVSTHLASNPEKKAAIENMIIRDVLPIQEMPTLPIMTTGLVLNEGARNTYSDSNPIPIDIDKPKGLVFRVQIGAFARPVPNETFKEFSPVTGENVRPGLIRYMAGFFGSRGTAEDARDRIRSLGYSDAFVVAYCDGERIPVYRAVELMNAGACVPTITTPEEVIITSDAPIASSNLSFEKKLDKFAYNKAPGAAEADAAEAKMGLYFTVQVGVYNRPVSHATLYNIEPLITKRLDNGQIRYSSGIFNSVDEARPHQTTAIRTGISDAFITAYYQGHRISLSKAREILQAEGNKVLELNNPTELRGNEVVSSITPSEEVKEQQPAFLDRKSTQYVWKSIERYEYYPTQQLNRYNKDGDLYYYDNIQKRIYSTIQQIEESSLYKDEFELVELYNHAYTVTNKTSNKISSAIENSKSDVTTLEARILEEDLNSDVIQAILNAPAYKDIKIKGGELIVHFYALATDESINILSQLSFQLQKLGDASVTFGKILSSH